MLLGKRYLREAESSMFFQVLFNFAMVGKIF